MIYTLPLSLFKQLKAPESCRDPSGLLLGKQDPRLRIVTGGSSRETSNTQKNANYRCRGEVSSLPHETKSSLLEKRAVKPSAGFPFRKVTFQPPPADSQPPAPPRRPPSAGRCRSFGCGSRPAAKPWSRAPARLSPPGAPVPPGQQRAPGAAALPAATRRCQHRHGSTGPALPARLRRCLGSNPSMWK